MGGFWYVFENSAEIAFQQILIAVGVILAYRYFGTLWQVALIVSVLFAFAHVSQFVGHTGAWALTGAVAGAVSGIAIPYLILRVRSGIVYAFVLHWAFYIFMALWFLYV